MNALNGRLKKAGKPPVKLVFVPDALEDEDMMEMLGVGLLEAIVVDDWKAAMWSKLLPKIRVNEQAIVNSGGLLGWGIRKDSSKLVAELNDLRTWTVLPERSSALASDLPGLLARRTSAPPGLPIRTRAGDHDNRSV